MFYIQMQVKFMLIPNRFHTWYKNVNTKFKKEVYTVDMVLFAGSATHDPSHYHGKAQSGAQASRSDSLLHANSLNLQNFNLVHRSYQQHKVSSFLNFCFKRPIAELKPNINMSMKPKVMRIHHFYFPQILVH